MVGTRARTPLTISSGLPSGVALMPMKTACCPFICTEVSLLSAPSSTVATSRSRTRAPPSALTTSCRNSSAFLRSVSALTLLTVK